MIKRILTSFILAAFLFGTTPAQTPSGVIFRLAAELSKGSQQAIWPDFNAIEFSSLEEGAIRFSPEPDNPEAQVFMRLSDAYFNSHALEENIAITFHEAFHGFERSPKRSGGKWGSENAMLVFEYEAASPRNNALFAVESRLLQRALMAEDEGVMKKAAADFLSVRRTRQRELDPRFVEFEKGAELNEGLAEYAGTKAVLEAFRAGTAKSGNLRFKSSSAEEYFTEKYAMLEQINRIGSNVRRKFYYTGSAQAFLLDRLMPGQWKNRIQMDGATVQDLLAESVDESRGVLADMGYEGLLEIEKKEAENRAAANRKLLSDTLSAPGLSLTVDYSALGGLVYIRQFDPMNVTMIDETLRVHTRTVNFGSEGLFAAEFNRPVVEDLKQRRYAAVIPGEVKIEAGGKAIDPGVAQSVEFSDGLKISAEGVEMTVKKGWLAIGQRGLVVTIAAH